jgi:hypothetical protein
LNLDPPGEVELDIDVLPVKPSENAENGRICPR